MSDFKLTCEHDVSTQEAQAAADELEKVIGEIIHGKRKPGNIPMEPMTVLVQYALAVDRGNERIAHLYEPTHPAVLQLIRLTVEASHRHGIWTGVCGETAGNPILAPLLVGMGVDELSASPGAVPLVKDVLRRIRFSEAQDLAEAARGMSTGAEVLDRCRALVRRAAPEILELAE